MCEVEGKYNGQDGADGTPVRGGAAARLRTHVLGGVYVRTCVLSV